MRTRRYIPVLMVTLLCGCAHVGTVRTDVSDPEFREQCQPVRMLTCVVFSDGTWSDESIRAEMGKVSVSLAKQVGIKLGISTLSRRQFRSTEWKSILKDMRGQGPAPTSFDMAFAFVGYGPLQAAGFHGLGVGFMGCIDDTYRRYVVIKHLDYRVILHEVSHAFVLGHDHDLAGSMGLFPVKFPILPHVFNMSEWLTLDSRQEVLSNKWRDFSQRVDLKGPHKLND